MKSNIDWNISNLRQFRFKNDNVIVSKDLSKSDIFQENSAIVFKIDRFNTETLELEQDYAFTMLPLFEHYNL